VSASPVEPRPADLGALQEVLQRSGVDTAMPVPSWTAYLQALAEGFARWFSERIASVARSLGARAEILAPIAWVLIAVASLLLLVALARLLAGLWKGAGRRGAGSGASLLRTTAPAPERDQRAWRREVEARLAGGRVKEALEAVWWWLARSLSPDRARASWTSGDLLREAERLDLVPLMGALDALAYAGRPPDVVDVRRLLDSLEAAVP
jgi:hypothetical protein